MNRRFTPDHESHCHCEEPRSGDEAISPHVGDCFAAAETGDGSQ